MLTFKQFLVESQLEQNIADALNIASNNGLRGKLGAIVGFNFKLTPDATTKVVQAALHTLSEMKIWFNVNDTELGLWSAAYHHFFKNSHDMQARMAYNMIVKVGKRTLLK